MPFMRMDWKANIHGASHPPLSRVQKYKHKKAKKGKITTLIQAPVV